MTQRVSLAVLVVALVVALLGLDRLRSNQDHPTELAVSVAGETTSLPTPTSPTTTTTTAPPASTTVAPRRTSTIKGSRGAVRTPAAPTVTTAGGNSILARIAHCESGGSYVAHNAHSTASGKYEWLDTTWNHYAGYARAMLAPPEVQERRAQEDYARSGTTEWAASRACWG